MDAAREVELDWTNVILTCQVLTTQNRIWGRWPMGHLPSSILLTPSARDEAAKMRSIAILFEE
jgi:hypothetical protein